MKKTKPMSYNDNYPSIKASSILNEIDTLSNKVRILHSKSRHWEYEQEWRHIVEQGDKLYPWPAALTSVYFGCKTDISDIHLVKASLLTQILNTIKEIYIVTDSIFISNQYNILKIYPYSPIAVSKNAMIYETSAPHPKQPVNLALIPQLRCTKT